MNEIIGELIDSGYNVSRRLDDFCKFDFIDRAVQKVIDDIFQRTFRDLAAFGYCADLSKDVEKRLNICQGHSPKKTIYCISTPLIFYFKLPISIESKSSNVYIASISTKGTMITPTNNNGIVFFNNPKACKAHFESMHWMKKVISLLLCLGRYLIYCIPHALLRYGKINPRIIRYTNPAINFTKSKVVICLHGLNFNPNQFLKGICEIERRKPKDMDIYIPHLPLKGNAKLDDMVDPLFKMLKKWANTDGEKELVLVGISNGGRVARALDAKISIKKLPINKLKFVSVVGACNGSSAINMINKLGLSWLMSKNITKEMPRGSLRTKKLNKVSKVGWKKASEIKRDYTFIASPHDFFVPNYDSTLMKVPTSNA
ncbi:MAG: alpha/beta hydrolase, partial [Parachlamydiaceae bacterium]|nr:alpha/beta hydrolase [Parachlamydiaceae bacterium]